MAMLYGKLDVVVVEARGLTNLDSSFFNKNDKSDPYCVVEIESSSGFYRLGKTHYIDNCLNPKWFSKFSDDISQNVIGLKFTVKDKDTISSEVIGTANVPVDNFLGSLFDGKLDLTSPNGKNAGKLYVTVKFSGTKDSPIHESFKDKLNLRTEELQRNLSSALSWKSSSGKGSSFSSSEMSIFMHGSLDLEIIRAYNLINLDSSILSFSKKDVSDPYVVVSLRDTEGGTWRVATTSVIDNNLNPVWEEKFKIDVCHNVTAITFDVRDKDFVSSETIGTLVIPAEHIDSGKISGTFDLVPAKGSKKAGQLTLSMEYFNKNFSINSMEVPDCLFSLRPNNLVTLYQDAHCPTLPVSFANNFGYPYQPRSTWRDIYDTISLAKVFIYIVGWSVSAKVSLLRWEGEDDITLGNLLCKKAQEGVRIRLLLWDELTSNELNKTGAMSTEDEETCNFFKDTPVVVKLAPRDRYTKDLFSTKNPFTKLCYTHHQKTVIADAPTFEDPSRRHVVAYVGGLDLTGGRFDTPQHPLFRTLVAEHKDDFRNRMHPTTSASGPREPWHDIHSRVEGPSAMDVLQNFQERWDKQGDKEDNLQILKSVSSLDLGYQVSGQQTWNVQVFRSINSDSAIFDWQTSLGCGLTHKKGRAYDNSLHRAYIHQIRKAKRFIYIENQYFLGSSHAWLDCRDAKAGNLVPLEIAAKIEEKIYARERFSVYIVIPMFPEGKPADKVTQEILHWQYQTMRMMYSRIANALKSINLDAHPTDYLLFLCLGNKEGPDSVPQSLVRPEDPLAAAAWDNRRLMIYVHSKMAIFDDEYIIVGSANINDRSLSGNRDTEIAIGSYQPNYISEDFNSPRGDVGLFRRALWAEHMATEAPLEDNPMSVNCIRRVKQLAEEGLKSYCSDDQEPSVRHLLLYPLDIQKDGNVIQRYDCSFIPDNSATVIGARSKVFPSSLTT